MIFKHAKIMKDECDSKEGKLSYTGLDTAESILSYAKMMQMSGKRACS